MKTLVLKAGIKLLAIVYAPLKLFRTDPEKVVFLSRQSNEPTNDFLLLQAELRRQDPEVRITCICNRIEGGAASYLSFARDTIRSLYHLATSRVCVLDSYWPAVSVLTHKPDLTVIQMWHSLGKVKKSGLQATGKRGGRSVELAEAMHMHEGYDYIVAGAPAWNQFYCEGFGCSEDQLLNIGLPRLDVLVSGQPETAAAIRAAHPELEGKKVVIYAPTFRRASGGEEVARAVDERCSAAARELNASLGGDCVLVLKAHPNQPLDVPAALTCPDFSASEMLLVADVVVTDYSAIAIEAAAACVPTLYYLFDYDEYVADNGLNIDIEAEMPGCAFRDPSGIAAAVERACAGDYPYAELERYRERYVLEDPGHSTHDLAAFIAGLLGEPAPSEG